MSILIKGIDMPKNGEMTIAFASDENGENTLALILDTNGKPIEHKGVAEIHTPHGRLIDADCIIKVLKDTLDNYPNNYNDDRIIEKLVVDVCKQFVEHCPATTEAEVK